MLKTSSEIVIEAWSLTNMMIYFRIQMTGQLVNEAPQPGDMKVIFIFMVITCEEIRKQWNKSRN